MPIIVHRQLQGVSFIRMFPLARRLRWSASLRMLSSGSVMFKQSDKLRKAQLLKVWNETNFRDNSDIVRSILSEVLTLHDRALTSDVASKFAALGLHTPEDKFLAIESFEYSGDVRAVEVFASLNIEEGLSYIVDHVDVPFSSALARKSLDVYHLALSNDKSLLNNSLLGNCALRLYENIKDLSAHEVEHAVDTLKSLQSAGASIQLRTYEAIIAAANTAKAISAAESVYAEFKQSHPVSLVIGIESQRMTTLLLRRQYKECLVLYDSLVSSGIPLNERLVCCVVDACIHRQYFESAIKILTKWHDQGGVMTWPICRSTLQLATSIDNLVYRRSSPLVISSSSAVSIYQDGFLPRVDLQSEDKKGKAADVYAGAKERLNSLTSEQKQQLDRLSFGSPSSGSNPFLSSSSGVTNSNEKYDHNAEGAALTSPSTASSGAVDDSQTIASSAGAEETPQRATFDTRKERLEFFRDFLVRRVIGRILQTRMESAQYRHEPPVPEDVILMCAGQMVLQGELDTLLCMLQKEEQEEGVLSPVVKALFVVAPIQLSIHPQYWREFVGLIERMRSFRDDLSAEVHVAAITRCMLTLFKNNEMTRARKQFESLLPYFAKHPSLLTVFGDLIARGELQGVVRILKVLHGKGVTLSEDVLIGVLQSCGNLRDISVICNAWRNAGMAEYGDKTAPKPVKLSDDLMYAASDKLCLAFARILKYAPTDEQLKFIKHLKLSFIFSPEQSFLLTTGRPEPQAFARQASKPALKGGRQSNQRKTQKSREGSSKKRSQQQEYDDENDYDEEDENHK